MLYCAANMAPSLERRVAIDAARAAGQLLYTELHRPRRVAYKGTPTNLVTEMDARAEELVVGRLLAAFPDDAILAEERGAQAGRSGRRWIIDPLDGTTNYAHGVPGFAVSIGRVTNLAGGPLDLEAPQVVASNGRIHDAVLAVLAEVRAGGA